MPSLLNRIRSRFGFRADPVAPPEQNVASPVAPPEFNIAPGDPILNYFVQANGVVNVDRININLDSPALRAMKAAGVQLVLPFVNQGEVVALLNLGPRRSEQEYSRDDRDLLNTLALQAAPAIRVAQLVREQQAEAIERERIRQEMNVARQIQFELLPKEDPDLPGYRFEKYYEPAQAVGGDFYDFFLLSDGQLVTIVGDVSGKGVPAALVMANTRSVLRGVARQVTSPGEMLRRTNEILVPEMPMGMFVTCLCAVLEPNTGLLRYANAGHNPPYRRSNDIVEEMFARGLPLGILPDRDYEEKQTVLHAGECVLFYSDGLSEAHSPSGEMFGFDRLSRLMQTPLSAYDTVDLLKNSLRTFTGPDWEQEDDISVLILERSTIPATHPQSNIQMNHAVKELARFTVPSVLGNERIALAKVAETAMPLGLSETRLEELKTAVAEATMNAIEYGNRKDPALLVDIQVLRTGNSLVVRVTDSGAGDVIPVIPTPSLEAKLAEQQSPRGWGLFLIKSMVDDVRFVRDPESRHLTIELEIKLGAAAHPQETQEGDH